MPTPDLDPAVKADSRYRNLQHVLTCNGRPDDPQLHQLGRIIEWDLRNRAMQTMGFSSSVRRESEDDGAGEGWTPVRD